MSFAAASLAIGLAGPREPSSFALVEPKLPHAELHGHGENPHRRLLQLLRHERHDLRAILVYAVAVGLLSLAVPIAVQALINSIVFTTMLQPVAVLTVLVLLALSFEGTLRVLMTTVVEWMQQRFFVRTAVDMAERLSRLRSGALGRGHAPELANRFFDVMTVQKAGATLLLDGVGLVLQTLLGMALLAFYHPLLLAFDAVVVALLAFVVFVVGRGAVDTAINESKAKYAVASFLEDIARQTTAFRSAATRSFALGRVDDLCSSYVGYRRKHYKILVRQIIGTKGLQAFASAGLLGVGGLLVIQRQLTLGQLVAAELIVSAVLAGIAKLGKHLESYYDLVAAVDKLGHVVDLPLEESGTERLPAGGGPMSIQLLNVAASQGSTLVCEGVDLSLPSGARATLSGANGAGKSTLVELLFGLHRPRAGRVLVDGVDLREIDLEQFRSEVALVRDVELFDGSIVDNVCVGRHLALEDVRVALRAVDLLDEIMALPDGLETKLAVGGSPLSSGQARRLMIARAIVSRPRLVILDEALDGVDEVARRKVHAALFRPGAPWTLLVTTHAEDVAGLGDLRFRLERGRVLEGAR
ncbi:MAG: ATP-binding cassette domain-containing protein [Myxococcales bacterium]|nr:ATP-binding cassette domain-containing protein [Myxococcales bacterium]